MDIIRKFFDNKLLKTDSPTNFVIFDFKLKLKNGETINCYLNVLKEEKKFPNYLKNSDGAILTFDLLNEKSFELIEKYVKMLVKEKISFENNYVTLFGVNFDKLDDMILLQDLKILKN